MLKRLNIPTLAVACIALFVALGGTSYAAGKLLIGPKNIQKNAVTHKKIKNGHVRGPEIKNGAVQMADLSGSLQAQVQSNFELLDGAVTTAKLADNAVTSPKVAPDSLGANDLAENSADSSEIAGSAVTDSELASNAVDANEVENGSLNAVDVGQHSGTASRNFINIPAGSCDTETIDPSPAAASLSGRPIVVTPGTAFGGDVTFHAEAEGSLILLRACNPTAGPIDPDGAGTIYGYIVFG
jgi:hypothetical protein